METSQKEDEDALAESNLPEDFGEPEIIGRRIPIVWAIIASAGLWALLYVVYVLVF